MRLCTVVRMEGGVCGRPVEMSVNSPLHNKVLALMQAVGSVESPQITITVGGVDTVWSEMPPLVDTSEAVEEKRRQG